MGTTQLYGILFDGSYRYAVGLHAKMDTIQLLYGMLSNGSCRYPADLFTINISINTWYKPRYSITLVTRYCRNRPL